MSYLQIDLTLQAAELSRGLAGGTVRCEECAKAWLAEKGGGTP
jgi:hypothetical protein